MLDRINLRYKDGGGEAGRDGEESRSGALRGGGVLVHQFDTIDGIDPQADTDVP